MSGNHQNNDVSSSIRRHLVAGLLASVIFVGGAGAWAASTNLSGAVVASGHFVVDSYVQVGVAAEDELRRIYLSRLSQAPFNNSPFTGERTVLFFCEAAVRINQPGIPGANEINPQKYFVGISVD